MQYRPMAPGEEAAVAALARAVFDAQLAPALDAGGRARYHEYAAEPAMTARGATHCVWTAWMDGRLVGMLEVRDGTHVAMLFVDPAHQRAGVGRGLLAAALGPPAGWPTLTVNSVPQAVSVYERLGFRAAAREQDVGGLRFVPMIRLRAPDVTRGPHAPSGA